MKTRVTISIDPGLLREARAVARLRKMTLSALIEELLEQATRHDALPPASFSQKWVGKFDLRPSDGDPLLGALKDKYGLS
jgi:hypothetical protein